MAQGVAIKKGSTFYAINLASRMEDVSSTVTRLHWSCNIQFGNWYLWGVRLHVAVDGVEVGSWAGACTRKGQVVIDVAGSRDLGRWDSGRDVKVEAWSTSETVGGYGGVGITTSCHEFRNVPAIRYEVPNPPSGMSAWRNSDRQNGMSWRNNPDGVVKKYTQLKVTRLVDGGQWHELKVINPDAHGNLPTSFVDNDVYANHVYRYAVHAANNAGWTVASHSGYVYTTPSSPSNCWASRKSDWSAAVGWNRGDNWNHSWANVLLERRDGDGQWVQIAKLPPETTNYTDNSISPNHRYDYRVRAYNGLYSGYSTQQGYIYTTPSAPRSVSVAKIGGTNVRISVSSASPYADDYRYQLSVNGGSWTAEKAMGTSADVDAGGGSVKARVRARKGDLYSAYTESDSVTTIVAPNAPSVGELEGAYPLPATVRVTWVKMHPDGTAQTAAQVEVTNPSNEVTTIDVASESFADVELTAEGEYRIRVRTKGLDPSWGAWSNYTSLNAAYAPQIWFSSPGVDGGTVTGMPATAEWVINDTTGVSEQEISLLDSDGLVVAKEKLSSEVRSWSFGTYENVKNRKKYRLQISVTAGSGIVETASRTFVTDWLSPAIPYVKVTFDESMSAHIQVEQGKSKFVVDGSSLCGPILLEGDELRLGGYIAAKPPMCSLTSTPDTKSFSVSRVAPDGTRMPIANGLKHGQSVIDRLPPLNAEFIYEVTAYADSGQSCVNRFKTVCHSRFAALNFGPDAGTSVKAGYDAEFEYRSQHSREMYHFASGITNSLPVRYDLDDMDVNLRASWTILDRDEAVRMIGLSKTYSWGWFRDLDGNMSTVSVDIDVSRSATGIRSWNVSAEMAESVWEEPVNGDV